MLAVSCACGAKFKAKPEHAGKKAKCPKCSTVLVIPGAAAPKPAAAPTPRVVPPEPDFLAAFKTDEEEALPAIGAPAAAGCPNCGMPMQAGAVLCVACGYNAKTGKALRGAKAPSAAAIKAGEVARATGAFAKGVICCSIGAAIGAAIWVVIAWNTGYEIGYVAWALGGLAGVGMMIGVGGEGSTKSGAIAAAIAFAAIVGSKVVVAQFFIEKIMKAEKKEVSVAISDIIEFVLKSMINPMDALFVFLAVATAFKVGAGLTSSEE